MIANKTKTVQLKMRESRFWPALSRKRLKFQFALKIGWRALAEGESTKTFPNWRKVLDLLNYYTRFALFFKIETLANNW